jgi:hypothetical protein
MLLRGIDYQPAKRLPHACVTRCSASAPTRAQALRECVTKSMHAASHAASSGQVAARRRWGSYFTRAQACRGTLGEAGGHRGRQWGDRNIRAQVPYPAITLPCAARSPARGVKSAIIRGGRPACDPTHACNHPRMRADSSAGRFHYSMRISAASRFALLTLRPA